MTNHPNRKPKLGASRFMCWITPADAVVAGARRKGWTLESECSPNEFVEAGDFEVGQSFKTLQAAVDHGSRFCSSGQDWWGQVFVYQQEYRIDEDTDKLGWVSIHKWIVTDTGIDDDHPVDAIAY